MTRPLELNFAGQRAVVLHPAATVRDQIVARLKALGLQAGGAWPPAPGDIAAAQVLLVDIDTGHDDLFPWETAMAPIPVVGLVRSEAPGRLTWALRQDFDAFLPLAATSAIYSTLVIAAARCADRQERAARERDLARRTQLRPLLVRAVLTLMEREGLDEAGALGLLRRRAMEDRETLEDAAVRLLSEAEAGRMGQRR